MNSYLLVLSTLTCFSLYIRFAHAGFCTQTYSCPKTCYDRVRYKTKCGFLGWRRCTRYRQQSRSCTGTCSRQVCCTGFTGSSCNIPMCFGSTTCSNGGTCVRPNNCACRSGYAPPRCQDINECSAGSSGCSHICTNTAGSFTCSCRSGYTLQSDRRTCSDINECRSNNGGCQHTCINEVGKHRCSCRAGYTLNKDGRTCSDVNECTPGRCGQICSNTPGSYTCSCRQGYALDIDRHKCNDIDECSSGGSKCSQACHNTVGSYTCSCKAGYVLGSNGFTCEDKNECEDANGMCQQICNNEVGFYTCACKSGYELQADGKTCRDIDECALKIDGCSQICTNTDGSFICSCKDGFAASGKSCINIDDCKADSCLNGGSCIDDLNSFTCTCLGGFSGLNCENDIDECSFLNGGCQDVCSNNPGSFKCSCQGNKTLESDGKTCSGTDGNDSVFRRHKLARQLLPRGCATLMLTQCKDGNNIEVHLSSTADWYELNSNSNVKFTLGIVFVEVNDLALPVSLNGVEVVLGQDNFVINLGANGYTPADGQPLPVTRTDDCISFLFTASDIFEFISSVSFLKSFFDRLIAALPPWLGFTSTEFSSVDVNDLKTDLIYGHAMDDVVGCKGAPVIPSHLYSVFRFSSEFSLSLYGNDINIPKPLNGRKFCLIVDICHKYGGSVFLMIPPESRGLLSEFDLFKNLTNSQGLTIKPRGLGLSVVRGVNVHYQETELELWNGDTFFTYPVFDRANLWIGGDVLKESPKLKIEGSADVFLAIPSPVRMLTAIFIDEWNILAQVRASATPTVTFKLFNKVHSITFPDMAKVSVDMYMSVGGTHVRNWCGAAANPPGVFLSSLITVNPFETVPILKDWIFDVPSKFYAFVMTDPASKITDDMKIDIFKDIVQVKEILQRFKEFVDFTIASFEVILTNTVNAIIDKLNNVLDIFESSIDNVIAELTSGNVLIIIDLLTSLWDELRTLETIVQEFLDETEHFVDETKDRFTAFIKNETDIIKSNLDNALSKVRSQVIGAAKDYSGVGLKFTTTINILGLKIIGIDIEFVHSVDSLLQCSRFDKVKQLLAGEKAARFLGRLSKGIKLGYFLKLDVGAGVGGAFSIDTDKFLLQLNAYASMLGIRATGDLFISRSGLYFYLEGNIWDIFLAQIDVSAEIGKEWYQLVFTLRGRFVAKARKRRQIQTVSNSFQASYLDALKKVVQRISDEADKRLSQAQEFFTKAQNGLTKAQNWLDEKQDDVDKANKHFDSAVAALEVVKDKLEAAKGPFQKAIEKLNAAQRRVDNICKIKQCSKICIPGVKCKICHKKVWGVRIPYPCCRFTSCMVKVPNLICEGANLICRGIRALAYAALEAAKLFVRIPMLALDVAKGAVSVAQFVVDKSRVVLLAAKGVLELAKIAIEAAKVTFEVAKAGLELVKKAIGVAAKILELVIEYGLKNLIDVRNCGFEVELSTVDLPIFDVSCEINAFRLGWKKVGIRINFKNILQSLWQAAKAAIEAMKKSLGSIFSGRRKRAIDFDSSSGLHVLLRKIRQAGPENLNSTSEILNDSINVINETLGFNDKVTSDQENRIMLYQQKCEIFKSSSTYLSEIFALLFEMVNETNTQIETLTNLDMQLQNYTIEQLETNIGLKAAGIDTDYLTTNYNVTMEQIQTAFNETTSNFRNDTFLNDLSNMANFSRQVTKSNIESLRSDRLLASWAVAIENGTRTFFDESQCKDFSDCIFYAISALYEIHLEESYKNIEKSKEIIGSLENNVLKVMGVESLNISEIYTISESILSDLEDLKSNIVFCKAPPIFTVEPKNITTLAGRTVTFHCNASSEESMLQYSWYKDGGMLQSQSSQDLTVTQVSVDDEGFYECVVGNEVANVTSRRAFLTVTDDIDDYPELLKQECLSYGCTSAFACYVPHPQSCTKFILCRNLRRGGYQAYVFKCGFGTMWKSIVNKVQICVRAQYVDCEIDPCKDPNVVSYDHADDNLRTYWRCDGNRSVPDCCPHHHRYDSFLQKCIRDANSTQSCALRNDDTCSGNNVTAIDYPDKNCRTYYECIDGHPHPACCPDGMEYDIYEARCVISTSNCIDTCPENFTDTCSKEGIFSYKGDETNCRTFMKCNSSGDTEEPFCCPPVQEYDIQTRSCVKTENQSCAETSCPTGYTLECDLEKIDAAGRLYRDVNTKIIQECPLLTYFDPDFCECIHKTNYTANCSDFYQPIPGSPSQFMIKDFDWTIRECAPGTVFDPMDCVCKFGETTPMPVPGKTCPIEVKIKMPYVENLGSTLALVMTLKNATHMVNEFGNMSELWDGSDGLSIPYYSQQKLSAFFIEVQLKPTNAGPSYKQVILSSCQNIGENSQDLVGLRSLELALMRFDETGGIFKLQVRSSSGRNMIEIDTPFMFNQTYTYRIIHNGIGVALQQVAEDSPKHNTCSPTQQIGSHLNVINAYRKFRGRVKIGAGGILFSRCAREKSLTSFIGNMKQIKISRCLPDKIQRIYRNIKRCKTDWNAVWNITRVHPIRKSKV